MNEQSVAVRLAAVFALRMAGLFLVLPVLADYARQLPGGEVATHVGLALGVYGLTQALLLLPFGWASDRWGRKPVIVAGLLLFIAGGLLAAWAPTIEWLIAARAIQGAGAISAAVTALVADLTTLRFRTRAMAMIGASIGLTFAGSLALAPLLYGAIGMPGIFVLTALLGAVAVVLVVQGIPTPPLGRGAAKEGKWSALLRDPQLLRLNFGVFVLHFVQMAMWVVVPGLLVAQAGLPITDHWQLYGAAVVVALAAMVPMVIVAERYGQLAKVYRAAVLLLVTVAGAFALVVDLTISPGQVAVILFVLLTLFFVAFNVLEATQPSWVSRLVPPAHKGAAMGVYNTLQSLGLFAGGAVGGWLVAHFGILSLFGCCALLAALWYASVRQLAAPQPAVAGGA